MSKYTFLVEREERYVKEHTIEADSQEEADNLIDSWNDDNDISQMSNTLRGMGQSWELIKTTD